jgi:hypothetical protein
MSERRERIGGPDEELADAGETGEVGGGKAGKWAASELCRFDTLNGAKAYFFWLPCR